MKYSFGYADISVLHCLAVHTSILQSTAVHCPVLFLGGSAMYCSVVQCIVVQGSAMYCSVVQCIQKKTAICSSYS